MIFSYMLLNESIVLKCEPSNGQSRVNIATDYINVSDKFLNYPKLVQQAGESDSP